MKKLARYLKGYTKECILGPLFKLFEAALELIVPLIIALIIDNGINSSSLVDSAKQAYVIRMSLVLVLLGAIGLAFSVTAQYFAAKAACGFIGRIRYSLFNHIQSLSYTELDTIGTSTLITRITSDSNQVQNGLNMTLRLLLRSPFVVFGAMIMAFTIDFKSALTFAAVIPALSVVIFGIMLISIPLHKTVQSGVDRVLKSTSENLSGARVIRAFCKEDDEIKSFRENNSHLNSVQIFVGRISALLNPLTYVLINVAIIFLIYSGAVQVNIGNLSQGQVVALYNYMSQILIELIKLANLIISITKALASASRIQSVFEVDSTMKFGTESFYEASGEVVFENVSLRYRGSSENSLSRISFACTGGQTVGIIGGTGSGKTSLVNLIPRFYDASEGRIILGGKDVRQYDSESLRQSIGIVPQRAVLFSGTIRENMKWGNGAATDEEIYSALGAAQALNIVEQKGGLDAKIEQEGRNLSGGQRQRLTIARALVKKPKILILDDSASALDYATDAKLRQALKKIKDTTVFIVSQRASSVMHADKILLLDDGELAAVGTHDQLLRTSPIYKEIYDTQFSEGGAI